jgi:TRAP-type C4-dicarboxylate transport system permease small subunit
VVLRARGRGRTSWTVVLAAACSCSSRSEAGVVVSQVLLPAAGKRRLLVSVRRSCLLFLLGEGESADG